MRIESFLDKMRSLSDFFREEPLGKMVSTDLTIVDKPFWLLRSFSYFACGIDCYSQLNPDLVAASIETQCRLQKNYLLERPGFIQKVCVEVLEPFQRKTRRRYSEIGRVLLVLRSWLPKVPENYLEVAVDFRDLKLNSSDELKFRNNFNEVISILKSKPLLYSVDSEKEEKSLVLYSLEDWSVGKVVGVWDSILKCSFVHDKTTSLVKEIVIYTKKVIGKGVDNKALLNLYLISNKRTVTKKCTNFFHLYMLKQFYHFAGRGVVPILSIHRITQSEYEFEEPCYPMTLYQFFNQYDFCWSYRIFLAKELLLGLQEIHKVVWRKSGEESFYSMSHGDLSLANILVDPEKNQVGIIDFGLSDIRDPCTGSYGYFPPESEYFRSATQNLSERISLRQEKGRAQDIWSMGLILFMIFVGGSYRWKKIDSKVEVVVPPLRIVYHELWVKAHITQENFDADIDGWKEIEIQKKKREEKKEVIEKAFSLVKKMLRLAYQERISASQAYQELENF